MSHDNLNVSFMWNNFNINILEQVILRNNSQRLYPRLFLLLRLYSSINNRAKRRNKKERKNFAARARAIVFREGRESLLYSRSESCCRWGSRSRLGSFQRNIFASRGREQSSLLLARKTGRGGGGAEAICLSRTDSFRLQTPWIVCARAHPL